MPNILDVAPPDEYPVDPRNSDELYEIYRSGMIKRHLCLNGRIDEVTWLREAWENASPRLRLNRRKRTEDFVKAGARAESRDPDALRSETIERRVLEWLPLSFEHPVPSTADPDTFHIPTSWGGGDNPLLTSGLALATFSLEVLHGVSHFHSRDYAKQIFGFFLESEVNNSGFFLRVENGGSPSKFASTDEMLGVFVGLLYYYRMLSSIGDDVELTKVRNLVSRIADNMNSHGYWILPYADDFEALGLDGAFRVGEDGVSQKWGRQTGFIFAYAFRQFFRTICGKQPNCHWDKSEFDRYFAVHLWDDNNISDEKKWMLIAKLVEKCEVDAWDYASAAILGALAGAVAGGPAGLLLGAPIIGGIVGILGTAAVDRNLEWDSKNMFVNLLEVVEGVLDTDSAGIRACKTALALVSDVSASDRLKKDYYNIHLVGLATILAVECSGDSEVRSQAGRTFRAIVNDCDGKKNSFWGILARYFGAPMDDAISESIGILKEVPKSETGEQRFWHAEVFQHDLPLASVRMLELLYYPAGIEPVDALLEGGSGDSIKKERCELTYLRGQIAHWLNDSTETWWNTLRAWKLPANPNPDNRWGGSRTWEKKYGSHVLKGPKIKVTSPTCPSNEEIVRELFCKGKVGLAMAVEACGADLLFSRMLGAAWGILDVPVLSEGTRFRAGGDFRWPTLPYCGATPIIKNTWLSVATPAADAAFPNRWPQKRLIKLSQRYGGILPITGKAKGGPMAGLYGVGGPPPRFHYGRQFTIRGEVFRGTRIHGFDGSHFPAIVTYLRTPATDAPPSRRPVWHYYLQITESRLPDQASSRAQWQPATENEASMGVFKSQVWEKAAGSDKRITEVYDLLPHFESSIWFVQVFARLVFPYISVGNEMMVWRSSCSPAQWVRRNVLPSTSARYRYFLNPHQGTVHDSRCSNHHHFQSMIERFNVLVLPIDFVIDRAFPTDQLNNLVLNAIRNGATELSHDHILPLELHRRDEYLKLGALVPVDADETMKRSYNARNTRHIRLCTYCFPQ